MATVNPTIRPSHRAGVVLVDQAAPEATLSVLQDGAHLSMYWTLAQARNFHATLGALLGHVDRGEHDRRQP